jgi:hypothetical protein
MWEDFSSAMKWMLFFRTPLYPKMYFVERISFMFIWGITASLEEALTASFSVMVPDMMGKVGNFLSFIYGFFGFPRIDF